MAKKDVLKNIVVQNYDSFQDHRGQLYTIWEQKQFKNLNFNHDKVATSKKNVLRGLHTDKSWKLITCLYGKIQLVVANYISSSDEYLDHMDITVDADSQDKISILVPPGFLNGHLVLSEFAVFHYKWSYEGNYPDIDEQQSVNWAEPKLNINWLCNNPILSNRDKNTPLL